MRGHRSPYLSHAKRALYHLSYIHVEETGSYFLMEPSLCYWNSWTESSIAYRCNFGFVGAGHQSMCFSHANRLPSRLTCLAGGVHMSCVCQTDVFDSLISIVMFPPTSFWGKPWWFRTPIPFSASSVLFQMLPFAYWTYKSMSSFGLTKQLTVFPFLIAGLLWKIGDAGGIDPRTSRMQSERSTISATSLMRKRAANDIWSLSFVNAMVEQFSIAYGCKMGFVDAVHQSMCFSHANRLPSRLTCLIGGVHMSCVCQTDVFDCLISRVYLSFDVFLS